MSTKRLRENYFTFGGRINRKKFIFRYITICSVNITLQSFILVPIMVPLILYFAIYHPTSIYKLQQNNIYIYIILFFLGMINIPAFFAVSSLYVKRLQDLNKSGWLILLKFIPFVDVLAVIIMTLYLTFFKGTSGYNQYGEDPLININ